VLHAASSTTTIATTESATTVTASVPATTSSAQGGARDSRQLHASVCGSRCQRFGRRHLPRHDKQHAAGHGAVQQQRCAAVPFRRVTLAACRLWTVCPAFSWNRRSYYYWLLLDGCKCNFQWRWPNYFTRYFYWNAVR
jgi:hypothetical protein